VKIFLTHFLNWGKFFQKFFYEYFIFGIEPPFPLAKCHIWGGYGRGEGVNMSVPHIGGGCIYQIPPTGQIVSYNLSTSTCG